MSSFRNRALRTSLAAVGVLTMSWASSVFASPGVGITTSPQAGDILVDDRGMTLYRFTPDQPDQSTCYDSCAIAWPPVLADSVPTVQDARLTAGLGLAPRTDGTQQLTYLGMPLYYFVADRQPGDAFGQGSDNEWFLINPS